jgi:hypothetical protein
MTDKHHTFNLGVVYKDQEGLDKWLEENTRSNPDQLFIFRGKLLSKRITPFFTEKFEYYHVKCVESAWNNMGGVQHCGYIFCEGEYDHETINYINSRVRSIVDNRGGDEQQVDWKSVYRNFEYQKVALELTEQRRMWADRYYSLWGQLEQFGIPNGLASSTYRRWAKEVDEMYKGDSPE